MIELSSLSQEKPSLFPRLPKYLKVPFLLSLLIDCVLILSFLVFYFTVQPLVPIFYSLAQPAEYLAPKEWLALYPIFTVVITLLHLFIVRFFLHYERVMLQMFFWTTLVIQFLFALSFFRIIFIIT
jgi:hypothetical protein